MNESTDYPEKIEINHLHDHHPKIRAKDWRSPLVRRLSGNDVYKDGERTVENNFRTPTMQIQLNELTLVWTGLKADHDLCINTYQAPIITEFATLGLACILLSFNLNMEITEVTRRGEKADYWIGDKEALVEISGQQNGNITNLCDQKADQLRSNPFKKPGYVCVATYEDATSRLWYYAIPES